jgi:hypothetical protein
MLALTVNVFITISSTDVGHNIPSIHTDRRNIGGRVGHSLYERITHPESE